ncbi:MAG TPA: hypothetical protein VK522_16250 [Pseudolabrys sp.]|nr:hypothetical protein [Pseudolabrys sp.]
MRRLLIAAVLCAAASTAHAQPARVALPGKPLILAGLAFTNPDCSPLGTVTIRVLEPPEHGRVSVSTAHFFPSYSASNVRAHCNLRRVQGTRAIYVAQRGYTGPDRVVLEAIAPTGGYARKLFRIEVK